VTPLRCPFSRAMPAGNPPLTVRFHPLSVQEFTQNGVQTVRERCTMLVNLRAGPDDPPAKAGGDPLNVVLYNLTRYLQIPIDP